MSKVTAKYQITIPMDVRKKLGIVPGTEVDIKKKGKQYFLVVDPLKKIRKKWTGKFKDDKSSTDYISEIRGQI